MANGGSITWVLDVDDKNFSRGIDRASDKAESASKSIGNRLSGSINKAAKSALLFTTALTGAMAVGGGIVGWAVKSAAGTEELRTSLNTLTGSAKEGSKLFKDLYKFAATTPFETAELAKATQTMLSFGISSKNVMPDLKMLGDISMGNKEKLSGLSLAFSQVQSTGRLMGQDLLQMINSGFNPLAIISEKTGKSMAVLKEEMADGAISADMVREAMITATSAGGLFYKGMETGAQTLNGRWSTLKDTVGGLAREIVGLNDAGEIVKGGLVDKLKIAMEDLTKFLEEKGPIIKGHIMDTLGWIKDNAEILSVIIGSVLVLAFGKLAIAVATALAPLMPFIIIGTALGVLIQEIVKHFGGWEVIMQKLKPELEFWRLVLLAAWEVIKGLFIPALQDLVKAVKEFWRENQSWLIPVLKTLAVVIGVLLVGAIVAVLAIMYVLIRAAELFVRGWGAMIDGIRWINEKIVGLFRWLYNVLVGNSIIPDLVMGIVNWFGKLPNLIMSALSGLKNAIVAPFRDALQGALNLAKDMADKIRSTISKAFDIKKRNSPSILDRLNTLKDAVSGTLESIQIPTYSSQISSNLGGGNKLAYSTSTPNFTVNIGTYAGTDMEKRELARQIFEAYGDYAKSRGLNI